MLVAVAVVLGIVAGAVGAGLVVVHLMRREMVTAKRSRASFDETCERIERVVPAGDGWSFPMPSLDMHAKLAAKSQAPKSIRQIRLFFVCKPSLANRVLSDTPKMAAIMPCSWSVYELADGSVWVSHMNIGMMAKMMGGVVGESMGGVAKDDERFLEAVLN